ncbi:MAG: ammonia-forming cytochrome c nitrite reductase subunit c552 [Coriobacteriales bacterium]|nr:ammonia-forming cytochrome c nitrite reductase subunit c552 [Coriobacteriales bacterium]
MSTKRHAKRRKLLIVSTVVVVVALTAGIATGCAGKKNTTVGNLKPNVEKSTVTPAVDRFGIVKADQWKDIYPYEYQSYLKNDANMPGDYTSDDDTTTPYDSSKPADPNPAFSNGKADYLEMYPEIKTLGLGYGYAKYYTEPGGHTYSLWTVTHNGRVNENTKAGCIACKTPQFSSQVDEQGDSIFQENFWDLVTQYDENISCASCHGNDPMTLEVDRADWKRAMGPDADTYSLNGQVCGQCHCDYSMYPGTGVPTSPYDGTGVSAMTPDNALAWYDANMPNGDWTYASTGAKMIAVRHAEYEFNYGGEGNHMTNLGYDCNDCHMAVTKADDGTVYTSHYWTNPTDNDELIKNNCSTCHADIKAEVKSWQDQVDGRTHLVGLRAEQFIHNFEGAIAAGTLTDEQVSRLQYIQRASCYYWNFVAAENSEGAHNPTLSNNTLDSADALLDEGDQILGVSSVVES